MAGTGGGGCGTARGGHEPLRWLSAVEALLPNASQPAPRPPTGIRADKVKAQQAAQVAKKSERRLLVPDGGAACSCNKRTRTAAARTQWSPQQLYPCNLALRGGGRITIRSARLHSVNRWPHGSSYSQVPLPSPLQTRRRSTSARAASAPAWMTTCMTAWARTMSTTSCKRRGRSDLCARAPLRAWCPLAVARGANQAAPATSAPAVPSPAPGLHGPRPRAASPHKKRLQGPAVHAAALAARALPPAAMAARSTLLCRSRPGAAAVEPALLAVPIHLAETRLT